MTAGKGKGDRYNIYSNMLKKGKKGTLLIREIDSVSSTE